MLTWYGAPADPCTLPHSRVSVLPVSDQGPGMASRFADANEAASGAALATASRLQRVIGRS